jgi:hypothetical protein
VARRAVARRAVARRAVARRAVARRAVATMTVGATRTAATAGRAATAEPAGRHPARPALDRGRARMRRRGRRRTRRPPHPAPRCAGPRTSSGLLLCRPRLFRRHHPACPPVPPADRSCGTGRLEAGRASARGARPSKPIGARIRETVLVSRMAAWPPADGRAPPYLPSRRGETKSKALGTGQIRGVWRGGDPPKATNPARGVPLPGRRR